MPRFIDHEARRVQILDAALRSLAETGAAGLSFRAIAKELGGSSTLVTHYYGSRRELIADLTQHTIAQGRIELAKAETESVTARDRLMALLHWLVPGDEEGLREDRARFSLLVASIADPEIATFTETWEQEVREDLRERLLPLVSSDRVEDCVDLLRAITSGISAGVVEHPQLWPATRQQRVVTTALQALLSQEDGSVSR